ncbi:RHS repeat domain-containing protein [Ruminococcus bromii]|uniref:RHS repeat domain-containing protein n=1 Tax=Ruminococcus bromii TaxID=40518 RepID=UPI0026F2C9CE|nr:RHS repeat-associated core domain-containing protein [Ruminococcus bromii]
MIYNKQGLVTKAVDYSSGETSYYYYTFDGSLESEYRTSSDGSLTHYIITNADGNTVEKTSVNGQTKTITTGTDKDGKSFVSNDGVTNETSTDDFGRTTQVRTVRSDGKLVFDTDYEYANGKAENSTTNLVSKYSQSYGSDSVLSYDYSYDANGNITEIKQNGKLINKYTYDSLNELKEEYDYVNKFYINYSYDGAGNLQNKYEQVLDPTYGYPTGTQHGNTYEYTDTSWKDKLTKVNGSNISYDANGNPLTYRDGMSFEWENGRILKKINTSDKSVQMSYDSNGMRTQKTVDGVKTNYYYDSNKNLIALVKGNDTLLFYYDSDGSATSFSYNGTMYFYVKNLQGDVIRIIDLAGTEVASYVYDSWGNIKDTKGDTTVRELNPIRYRGYVYDTETSLYYLQSRYYDPFTGRFLNADVYCDTGTDTTLSTNMFAYCENNPVNAIDPFGYSLVFRADMLATAIDLLVYLLPAISAFNKIIKRMKYVPKHTIHKVATSIKKFIIKVLPKLNIGVGIANRLFNWINNVTGIFKFGASIGGLIAWGFTKIFKTYTAKQKLFIWFGPVYKFTFIKIW